MTEPLAANVEQFVKNYFSVTRSFVLSKVSFELLSQPALSGRWKEEELEEIDKLCRQAYNTRNRYARRTHAKQMYTDEAGRALLEAFCNSSLGAKSDPDKHYLREKIQEAIDSTENEEDAVHAIRCMLKSKVFLLKLKGIGRTVFRYRQAIYDLFKWLIGFAVLLELFDRVERTTDTIFLAVIALLYVRNRLQTEGQATALAITSNALDRELLELRWILKAEMPEESWLKVRKQQQDNKKFLALNYACYFSALPCIGLIFWKILAVIGIV